MRIAIDATSIPPQPAGAGIYAIELVRAMAEHDRHAGYALFTRGTWFDEAVTEKRNWRIKRVEAPSRQARLAWEQLRLPGELSRMKIDVLHSTHHTLPLRPLAARRVVTIHDVTFFRIPQRYPMARRFYMQSLTRLSAKVADAIIAPSQAAKDDIVRMLHVDPARVAVVYEAAAAQYRPIDRAAALAVAARYGLQRPYLLSVGSLEPGKNRARLIRALDALRRDGVEHDLVIVGQKAWGYEADIRLVEELGMRDNVRFLGYVKPEDLPALYNAATAFVFPSLYEGFGLGVIEAMACSVPVLTSNVSATAEVAGDAALLVDPHSAEAIREGIRSLLEHDALRATLAQRGLARAAEFSWARAAAETHAVYQSVAAGSGART